MKLKIPTKRKIPNKDQSEESDPAENGHDETEKTDSSSSVNISDADKEKGKFSNFAISKNTIQKLKGRLSIVNYRNLKLFSFHFSTKCWIPLSSPS